MRPLSGRLDQACPPLQLVLKVGRCELLLRLYTRPWSRQKRQRET